MYKIQEQMSVETENNTDQTLTNKNYVKSLPRVLLVDSDETMGLEVYNYNSCSDNDTDVLKQCRGLVFQHDNLIFKGFTYTREYTYENYNNQELTQYTDLSTYRCFDAHEGTTIRVFYVHSMTATVASKWYISTPKKLNVFRSKWSSKVSFGEKFETAVKKHMGMDLITFLETLNKSRQYIFLLKNDNDNRIVCTPGEKSVYLIATLRHRDSNPLYDLLDMDTPLPVPEGQLGISFPNEYKFNSMESLIDRVEDNGFNVTKGIICITSDKVDHPNHFKMINSKYNYYQKIRNNVSSIKYRYLEIRLDADMVSDLIFLYPEYKQTFDAYEGAIYNVAKLIIDAYKKRYIMKEFISVGQSEYGIMRECHGWHIKDRTRNKISLDKVIDVLNQTTSFVLNRIIKRFLATGKIERNFELTSESQ